VGGKKMNYNGEGTAYILGQKGTWKFQGKFHCIIIIIIIIIINIISILK
jgi:hypothetical protein